MGAVQEYSRQLETTGYTESLALDTPTPEIKLSVTDDPETVNRDFSSPEQGELPLPGIMGVVTPSLGFEPLSKEKTTFAYNRFLYEVVPNHSLGCIRLVAWMMFHTTHQKLHHKKNKWQLHESVPGVAKIIGKSERTAYSAIKEAEDAGFIICVRPPQKCTRYAPAVHGIWELNTTLDEKESDHAFYDGLKYRTPLPNRLVLNVVMEEDLTMVRLLCCIARHTIGFAEPDGKRRLMAEIGLNKLLRDSGIGSKTWLLKAKRAAVEKHYIKLEEGPDGRTCYGFQWSREWDGDRSKICTTEEESSQPQQKMYQVRSKECTSSAAENVPDIEHEHSKKCTTINRVSSQQGYSNRQHETPEAVHLLLGVGFDKTAAADISEKFSLEVIKHHVEQFEFLVEVKKPGNALGMLRKMIQENWGELKGYREWRAAKERQAEEQLLKKRKEHRNKFYSKWSEYLTRRIEEIEAKHPREWKEFLRHEEELLAQKLEGITGPMADKMRPTLLAMFKKPENRRERALDYFAERILGFWEWDKQCNPEGYEE